MAPLAGFAALACGHGTIVWPPSRMNSTWKNGGSCVSAGSPILPAQPCASPAFQGKTPPANCVAGGSCLWFNQGCTIGCKKCGDSDGKATCKEQGKPTLPKEFRTWTGMHPYPTPGYGCTVNPWCAPGSAPVFDPCGVTGGGYQPGKNGNGGVPPDFYKQGHNGSHVSWGHTGVVTKWVVGQTYDIAWAITANHGGGYQYRLCPKDDAKVGGQAAERCFQKTPLDFANTDTQWIQWGDDDQTRLAIPTMTLTTGVVPAGSQWRRNGIPACTSVGGSGGAIHTPCTGFEFPPPGVDREYPPGFPARAGKKLGGFGAGACDSGENNCGDAAYAKEMFAWSIVDQVKVPDVPPGDYVLAFRWDSEQTPQIWSGCSDLTITADGPPAPVHPHPPLPAPGPPPAADSYVCMNSQCVTGAGGAPLATCQLVCG